MIRNVIIMNSKDKNANEEQLKFVDIQKSILEFLQIVNLRNEVSCHVCHENRRISDVKPNYL